MTSRQIPFGTRRRGGHQALRGSPQRCFCMDYGPRQDSRCRLVLPGLICLLPRFIDPQTSWLLDFLEFLESSFHVRQVHSICASVHQMTKPEFSVICQLTASHSDPLGFSEDLSSNSTHCNIGFTRMYNAAHGRERSLGDVVDWWPLKTSDSVKEGRKKRREISSVEGNFRQMWFSSGPSKVSWLGCCNFRPAR